MALTKIGKEGITGISNSSDANAITIDSSENVGIGTSSPTVKLDIVDDGVQLRLANSTTGTTTSDGSRIQLSGNDLLLVNRESAKMQFYTADTERMSIDSAGHVTMPYQSAFQARPQSPNYTQNIALSTVVDVNFGNEIFDRNGDFSSNTFTAPVTGLYQLNLSAYVENLDTASTYFQLNIATSNRNYVIIIDPNFSSDLLYFSKTVSVLADMDANDTAVVQAYQVGGTAQTDIVSASTFSGYLVA